VFERFTDGSRRAVVLAQESAVELHHRSITVEHLLLGVARAHQGAGTVALAELGITPDLLRAAVRKVVPAAPDPPAGDEGHVPFTPAAKKVLEYSLQEAMRRGADAIDNGHIVLALLRQGGDELPAVLTAARLDGTALVPAVEEQLLTMPRPRRDPPSVDRGQLERIETLLVDVQARLARIEARLDRRGPV
jgi:ATP-dependent Clp protease ATP-binding subunit ClpC